MNRNKKLAFATLGTVFVLFNVLAFVIPTEKTAAFWVVYAFSAVAFIAQIAIWQVAFCRADTLKRKFLAIPIVRAGVIGLVVQLIAFAVFMAAPHLPIWVAVLVSAVIFGVSAVYIIAAEVGRNAIEAVDEKVQRKTFDLKALQIDLERLAEQEADPEVKSELLKLAEAVRFSDPMSDAALADIENQIRNRVESLKNAENKAEIIKEVNALFIERNQKAKLLK